jgi:hypothetical protein
MEFSFTAQHAIPVTGTSGHGSRALGETFDAWMEEQQQGGENRGEAGLRL